MSHQTGSLMRRLGVRMGLGYHQPAPGSASHHAVVPGPRPGCQGHWFCGFISTVQALMLQLRAQACHEFQPSEPQRFCASSALVFSPHRGSAAGGWRLFLAPHPLAAVSLPLQAEPHMLQQPRLCQELLVWACFLPFWSLSHCLHCGTRFGWPGLCGGVMVVQWEEHGWKEAGFPSQVPGLLLLGVCATGQDVQPGWEWGNRVCLAVPQ